MWKSLLTVLFCPWQWKEKTSHTTHWRWKFIRSCRFCSKVVGRNKKCSKCGLSYYCSLACQKSDYKRQGDLEWSSHVHMCVEVPEMEQKIMRNLRNHPLFYALVAWLTMEVKGKKLKLMIHYHVQAEKHMVLTFKEEEKPVYHTRSLRASVFRVSFCRDQTEEFYMYIPKLGEDHDTYIQSLPFSSVLQFVPMDKLYSGELQMTCILLSDGLIYGLAFPKMEIVKKFCKIPNSLLFPSIT